MPTPRTTKRRRTSGWMTRGRGKMLVVFAATFICLYLSYRLARPFLPALVWSVTAAVVTRPLVHWLQPRIKSPSWRAGLAVSLVALVVFAPVIGLTGYTAVQISGYIKNWQPTEYLTRWQEAIADREIVAQAWDRISTNLDLTRVIEQLAGQVRGVATAVVSGTIYTLVQTLLSLFILFYLYRDEDRVLTAARQLSPLTDAETDHLITRLGDTIHATIFGTVVVAIIQGLLGGVIFWMLGLPAPVLWGTIMAFMSVIPYLGSFVVWVPASIFLAANSHWGKALLLVGWGTVVIGLIDNLLYPILVGNRLRQHTVIAFIAIVGGLAVFGASGIVLGPVVASLTFFLLEVWRRRTTGGRPAEAA